MRAKIHPKIKKQIQDLITKKNVDLYIGGEPTFVVKNPISEEWNAEALGDEKYKVALELALGLSKRAPEGSIFFKPVGKLYPGELAARWSFKIIYKKDKQKIWNGNHFMANYTAEKAKTEDDLLFMTQFAKQLNFETGYIIPIYSNPYDSLEWEKVKEDWKPKDISQEDEKLIGYALPLNRVNGKWVSEEWKFLKHDKLYALNAPGQLGLRLPLNSLVPGATMAALVVEVKEERLCVFIPPLKKFEDFLNLLHRIEEVCQITNLKSLCLDGYLPPLSSEFQAIGVVPDPGVVEINLPHCSGDWEELEHWLNALFECTEEVELFPYRWKYTGEKIETGGGGHITIGGADYDTSPFFQVPHLLPSVIRFFQNHPSMSYLFSGQFIGPTSQAPRVDEGIFDNLHELEITLAWAESLAPPINRELFQNNFRNLLTDLTGNTHRSEITIDKLSNPFMKDGNLGVVEFRAFGMPHTLENYLLLSTLILSLTAVFLNYPYKQSLIDFGISLHDKYFLPYYIWEDFRSVISYLNEFGISFVLDDFRAFLEFRFPIIHYGSYSGGEFVIRKALELWPVMAEQSSSPQAATSRLVDASMHRLQFELYTERKIILLVNDTPIPLFQERDCLIGAVRYKAYYSFPAFQIHISPLSFINIEIVCAESKSILFSAIYYSWKPDITPYEGLPLTSEEAENRQKEKFKVLDVFENNKKNYTVSNPKSSGRYPITVDLRVTEELHRPVEKFSSNS